MITQDDINKMHEIIAAMIDVGREYHKIKLGQYPDVVTINEFNFSPTEFEVECETLASSSHDRDYYHPYRIPYSYLWDYSWMEEVRQEQLAANIRAVEARLAREKAEQQKQIDADRKLYEQLKQRFESAT